MFAASPKKQPCKACRHSLRHERVAYGAYRDLPVNEAGLVVVRVESYVAVISTARGTVG